MMELHRHYRVLQSRRYL